jgi:8-oxo-dGTP diphosphatase
MQDRHRRFDADKLFRLKSEHSGYRYCPRCRTPLTEQRLDGTLRLACPSADCEFVFYQNPAPAAGAMVVSDDRILLVKRAHPPKVGWWCLPAGFMEWQEHPSQTAVREVREETGLDIRLAGFFEVYSGTDDPRTNAVLILYLGEVIGGLLSADDDAAEVRYFSFDDLPENIAFASHRQALKDYVDRFRKKTH